MNNKRYRSRHFRRGPSRPAEPGRSLPHEPRSPDRREIPLPAENHPLQGPAKAWREGAPAQGVFAGLLPELRRALAEEGYAAPTAIQAQAIPHLLEGRDILGCAQTGTGKTAAFTLPILQRLALNPRVPLRNQPRVLVLAPTRELAAQIGDSIRTYGRHLRIHHTVIYGGVGQQPQVNALSRGVDIAVATPGRLLDLMQQGHVKLGAVEVFVLDEADRMLDMGFIPDVKRIIAALPARRHSLFFSATLPPPVIALARTLVHDPVQITIAPRSPTVERIAQKVLFVDKENKNALLIGMLRELADSKALVFIQRKHAANKIAQKIIAAGIPAAVIHGNKSQGARTEALTSFKAGRVGVLVATDIAARGLDVDGITHVINYELPVEPETYVHRIGRTGRAESDGVAISFCSAAERESLNAIESFIRKTIPVDARHEYHSESAEKSREPRPRPHQRGRQQSHRAGSASQHGGTHARAKRRGFRAMRRQPGGARS